MNVLYVTDAWHGFSEALFSGATSINGLPSFGRVLEKIVNDGNSVDFIVINNSNSNLQLNIGLSWIRKEQIVKIINYEQTKTSKIRATIELLICCFSTVMKKHYDFVYAHGLVAGLSIFSAKLKRVPFGQRLYGTFLWDEYLRNAKVLNEYSLHKKYYNIIAYRYKKAFLLITNDGSRGDLAYKKICKNKAKFEFLYWINGVKRLSLTKEECGSICNNYDINPPFIFYAARFDRWKNQDRVIGIMKRMKEEGLNINCYFAGAVTVKDYYNEVLELVKNLNLEGCVHFLGNLNYTEISAMHKAATASLALYSVCNFTNVFHEMLANGAVAIVKKDGVVDTIIRNGENGYLVGDDDGEVINIIKTLLESPISDNIRQNAIQTSLQYIKEWDTRVEDEVDLIKKYAKPGMRVIK